jgi:hypothetical protein
MAAPESRMCQVSGMHLGCRCRQPAGSALVSDSWQARPILQATSPLTSWQTACTTAAPTRTRRAAATAWALPLATSRVRETRTTHGHRSLASSTLPGLLSPACTPAPAPVNLPGQPALRLQERWPPCASSAASCSRVTCASRSRTAASATLVGPQGLNRGCAGCEAAFQEHPRPVLPMGMPGRSTIPWRWLMWTGLAPPPSPPPKTAQPHCTRHACCLPSIACRPAQDPGRLGPHQLPSGARWAPALASLPPCLLFHDAATGQLKCST